MRKKVKSLSRVGLFATPRTVAYQSRYELPTKLTYFTIKFFLPTPHHVQTVKSLPAMEETVGSVPGLGRSLGEWNGGPLQYSCLQSFMDRGAWGATVHGVTKSWTQ